MNYIVFTDGACLGPTGSPGGWAYLTQDESGKEEAMSGGEPSTTNNRMEMTAVIKALQALPPKSVVIINTDSQWVINGSTGKNKRSKNLDLWEELDKLFAKMQKLEWKWVKGHSGHRENDIVDKLARDEAKKIQKQSYVTG